MSAAHVFHDERKMSAKKTLFGQIMIFFYNLALIECKCDFLFIQGRRDLQKTGGSRAKKFPKINPPKLENYILLHFYMIILKSQGVS